MPVSLETRRLALKLYLEGLGFRAMGYLLQISYGTVYAWVKEWGLKVDLPKKEEGVEFMEPDEVFQLAVFNSLFDFSSVQKAAKKQILILNCCQDSLNTIHIFVSKKR
ncbi:hypothetical protein EZS27_019799 [termite gut metagenome]|uniref:Uncharacterized protein n=1 Tax=termite gut metagenome TaxID=433724 RepID=A0A5J4RD10_9ZZZZ